MDKNFEQSIYARMYLENKSLGQVVYAMMKEYASNALCKMQEEMSRDREELDHLKAQRLSGYMTRAEVCSELGVAKTTILRYEKNGWLTAVRPHPASRKVYYNINQVTNLINSRK